jgi:A/G-specific adenine glycosylase
LTSCRQFGTDDTRHSASLGTWNLKLGTLLRWFDRHQRSLPWRHSRDPYRIWVSEVMLQQTTVAAVIPYFNRFMARFPTVSNLAAADESEVLKYWQGLGYYRRARHLHAAAKRVVAEQGGTFPDDPAFWASLPGVGRYILGAVLSQAFERRYPIVEANSLRVLSRVFGSRLDPRQGEGQRWVWRTAETVLPRRRVGDFNQALMELGALVCTPTNPKCGECPLRRQCVAYREGLQAVIPPPKARKELVTVREVAVVIRRAAKLLIGRRPLDADRWANMWELPRGVVNDGETVEAAAMRVTAMLLGTLTNVVGIIGSVRHGVTRFDITLTAVEVSTRKKSFVGGGFYTAWAWVSAAEAEEYPMCTPQRKLVAGILAVK